MKKHVPPPRDFPVDSASQSDQLEIRQMQHAVRYCVIQPGFRETQSSRVWEILISPGKQEEFVCFVG